MSKNYFCWSHSPLNNCFFCLCFVHFWKAVNDTHTHDLSCHIFCMFGPMLGIPKLYFYVSRNHIHYIFYVQTCFVATVFAWAVLHLIVLEYWASFEIPVWVPVSSLGDVSSRIQMDRSAVYGVLNSHNACKKSWVFVGAYLGLLHSLFQKWLHQSVFLTCLQSHIDMPILIFCYRRCLWLCLDIGRP